MDQYRELLLQKVAKPLRAKSAQMNTP